MCVREGGRGAEKIKVNKEDEEGVRGREVQWREDKKCKRELAHGSKGAVPTEKEPCWVYAGGGRWQSGGLCIHACGCVPLCAVCKGRSAIFNIPVSPDLEYQNNLSGSIQMLLPLHTFLPPHHLSSSSSSSSALFSPSALLTHMVCCFNCYSSDKTDICF